MHDNAMRQGIKVVVFGSMSAAGQRLNNLTGIAAILRYEFVELQDMVDGEDEGDLDSDEDEGEIGGSQAESMSNIDSTMARQNDSASANDSAAGEEETKEPRAKTGSGAKQGKGNFDFFGLAVDDGENVGSGGWDD